MTRETINLTIREIAAVIAAQEMIAAAEVGLAETAENKAHWEGYQLGLHKAFRAIEAEVKP